MRLPTHPFHAARPAWLAAAALALLSACSEPQMDAALAAESSRRVIVTLASDWTDAPALTTRLSEAAQVPARDLQPVAARQWAITLICKGPAACDAATERMSLLRDLVLNVEADHLQRIPQRPDSTTAR